MAYVNGPAIIRESNDKIEPDQVDYATACVMMADLHNRESWSVPFVLAQWVAKIRQHERGSVLT